MDTDIDLRGLGILVSKVWKTNSSSFYHIAKNFVNLVTELSGVNNNHNLDLLEFSVYSQDWTDSKSSSLTRSSWCLNDHVLVWLTSGERNGSCLNLRWLHKAHVEEICLDIISDVKIFTIPVSSGINEWRSMLCDTFSLNDFNFIDCFFTFNF